MTTSVNPAPAPTDPGPSTSESSEMWRAIGRLEGTANALLEGQRRLEDKIDTGLSEQRAYFESAMREQRAYFESAMREQRTHFESSLGEQRTHSDTGLREVNRRVDRLFYTMMGVGGALVAAIVASRLL